MPFIVATNVYATSQGQRTHSARTNVKYEPREHRTSFSDVPQLTTQVQTSPHTDEEEDGNIT